MSKSQYRYFDEAYFQDGSKRGTAYTNYKEGARSSPTFREIAVAVREVFQPRRVLEIGCATGVIVKYLNELGCEAHGIDVSEWAVRNAEHRNVRLAPADALPYPDGFFDLIISCHSLEHLPDAVFSRSLAELGRVGSAFQFHMLPIVGTEPYDGDPDTVREQLRKDPTHQQLHSREEWLRRFEKHGWDAVHACILFRDDTATVELSSGQFIVCRSCIDLADVLRHAVTRNQRIYREMKLSSAAGAVMVGNSAAGRLTYADRIWKDVERHLRDGETVDLLDRLFQLVVIVEGRPCVLRFAAGQDDADHQYAHVGEFHMTAQPGCNVYQFTTQQLRTLRGRPDYSRINHVALGGENEAAQVTFYFVNDCARDVF